MQLPGNLPYPKNLDYVLDKAPEAKSYKVAEIIKDFDGGKIVIPSYQRADVWDEARKKALEYSVTHGLPVPPIMLVKCKGKLNLDDGQQRLKAIIWAVSNYKAAIANLEQAIRNDNPTAEAKKEMDGLKASLQKRLDTLNNAKIAALIWPEMTDEAEKYAYSALNNGKSHTGSEWGRAFIPAQGLEFIQNVSAQSKAIFGKKSVDFALYFWAAMGGTVKKTPAGKKVFPVVRREAESNDKFVFPEIPDGFADFLAAIGSRPAKNTEDYNQGDFCKPGFLVPFVQGLKIWGNWDMATAAYVVRNIDKYTLRMVTIIEREGKGKNGPVTVKKQFSGFLAQSGSGEMLTWRKAQGWAKVFRAAKDDMTKLEAEEVQDELLGDLQAAVAEMEAED